MNEHKDIWEKITKTLESDIPKSEFSTWFHGANLAEFSPDLAVIDVPHKFIANWLQHNYLGQIQRSFKTNFHFEPSIVFSYSQPGSDSAQALKPSQSTPSGPACEEQLNPEWTFNSFVTSSCNRFAYSSALNVANDPASHYNPLFMFCRFPLGKSHLLHAIAHQYHDRSPEGKIKCISAEELSSAFRKAQKANALGRFREDFRSAELLLLDDIYKIDTRETLQREMIALFSLFCQSMKQIVVTARTAPSQINHLLPQLRSRLESGLLSEIQIPDQKTKTRILKQKAKDMALPLPDDVAHFIANATNDLKSMNRRLVSLNTYRSLFKREIDISLVKTITAKDRLQNPSITDIQKVTAAHFGVSLEDILSNRKGRRFSYPRQVGIYLARKLLAQSYKEIGAAFGGRDHSTAIYAVQHLKKEMKHKKSVVNDVNKLEKLLSG